MGEVAGQGLPARPRMFPALLQLDIQMAQRGELAGEFRVPGSLDLASRGKIPAAKQVRSGNHRRAHGTVLISALRPCQIPVQPKIEAHSTYGIAQRASSSTAWSRSSLRKGLRKVRQAENCNANAGSGHAAI